MEFPNNIYRLETIEDDPRFEGFATTEGPTLVGGTPKDRKTRNWQKLRLAPNWKPVEVVGRVRKFNDFPGVDLMPAFSGRAVDALRDLLEPNGELLPLVSPLGPYFAYNLLTVLDALDIRRSRVKWIDEPVTAFQIERYELFPEKLGRAIFHLPERPADLYVNETFVKRVADHGLRGFDFQRVWPLPPAVDWRKLAKARAAERIAEGLPEGETVTGNTLVIRLRLGGRASTGSAAEREAVATVIKELDAMLVDVGSDAPAVGNLEGYDYGVAGECRLFLSCPDADALARKLRPWLKKLDWPDGFSVLKRYGNFLDPDAPEKGMKLS